MYGAVHLDFYRLRVLYHKQNQSSSKSQNITGRITLAVFFIITLAYLFFFEIGQASNFFQFRRKYGTF